MRLHQDQTLMKQAIQATADRLGLLPIYVEKDYWVTLALWHIFHEDSPVAHSVVFKGGTALSKCFHLIERFSEDIDLVLLQDEPLSDNQRKRRLKTIAQVIEPALPEIDIQGLTRKRGMIRKTAHSYPKAFTGDFGQVREQIVLECSWLGHYEPYHDAQVMSLIGQMMLNSQLTDMATQQGLLPFTVKVLSLERTFCEKIMSLVRFSYTEHPIAELKLKIRHCYDLHQLLQQGNIQAFIDSSDFFVMLNKVRADDMRSHVSNQAWLAQPLSRAWIFRELPKAWQQLQITYEREFSALVYGELPSAEQVFDSLMQIRQRLEDMPEQ